MCVWGEYKGGEVQEERDGKCSRWRVKAQNEPVECYPWGGGDKGIFDLHAWHLTELAGHQARQGH